MCCVLERSSTQFERMAATTHIPILESLCPHARASQAVLIAISTEGKYLQSEGDGSWSGPEVQAID